MKNKRYRKTENDGINMYKQIAARIKGLMCIFEDESVKKKDLVAKKKKRTDG